MPPILTGVFDAIHRSTLVMPLALVNAQTTLIADRRADVFKFARVEFDAGLTEHLAQKQAPDKVADRESVGPGDSKDMIRSDQAARARHIFHDDTGVTRNVFAQWRAMVRA